MLLAIDTSTSWASLALLREGDIVAHEGWAVGQRHSVEIFGGIERLLARAAITLDAVDALGVATGPGSFNGLRVAVTVAKTLAFVRTLPLAGVATLDGIAQAARGAAPIAVTGPVVALLEAGRDELYVGWYDVDKAGLVVRRDDLAITTVAALVATPDRPMLLAGEVNAPHRAALEAHWGAPTCWADPPAVLERASGIARLAAAQLAMGGGVAPMDLEPTYVRRPTITTSTRHPVPGQT